VNSTWLIGGWRTEAKLLLVCRCHRQDEQLTVFMSQCSQRCARLSGKAGQLMATLYHPMSPPSHGHGDDNVVLVPDCCSF
jgi:hypothetical protein